MGKLCHLLRPAHVTRQETKSSSHSEKTYMVWEFSEHCFFEISGSSIGRETTIQAIPGFRRQFSRQNFYQTGWKYLKKVWRIEISLKRHLQIYGCHPPLCGLSLLCLMHFSQFTSRIWAFLWVIPSPNKVSPRETTVISSSGSQLIHERSNPSKKSEKNNLDSVKLFSCYELSDDITIRDRSGDQSIEEHGLVPCLPRSPATPKFLNSLADAKKPKKGSEKCFWSRKAA